MDDMSGTQVQNQQGTQGTSHANPTMLLNLCVPVADFARQTISLIDYCSF